MRIFRTAGREFSRTRALCERPACPPVRQSDELSGVAADLNERGQPFNPQSVRAMIAGPQQRERRASQ